MTYLWTNSEWTFPLVEQAYTEIAKIGINELGLNPYPNEIEIISSEQMLDAYSSTGLPVMYKHWSFGKHFARDKELYDKGMKGLAYEIVLNSNPCINYLMEDNSMTMQALTMAHAGIGHSHFFRNNELFKLWTDASSIIDYLMFARDYITKCEVKEGSKKVEEFLDSCHTLQQYGVNRYKHPQKLSAKKEKDRQENRQAYSETQQNELFDSLFKTLSKEKETHFPKEPEENILYFCEKYSPDLPEWKRELIRIVRKVAQYFYPQGQTKIMNEGCATYTHYRILNRLHEKRLMTDGAMLEFIQSHTNVIYQPLFNSKYYSGMNPYAIGFAMMNDITRICDEPTNEDRKWFSDIAGCGDAIGVLKNSWKNYRDESFIRQFLSPKVMRDFKLFEAHNDHDKDHILISAIHDDIGFEKIRESLAEQHEIHNYVPHLEVTKVDPTTRELTIVYYPYKGRRLQNIAVMMPHLRALWGYPVTIKHVEGHYI